MNKLLKKKQFVAMVHTANGSQDYEGKEYDGAWINANRDSEGVLFGWFIGLSFKDEESVLITDKGTRRNFKTLDSAISFVAENALTTYGQLEVSYA